ncbi:MAG: glutathione S-transferase family protein [Parvibaculaceae bacterium]
MPQLFHLPVSPACRTVRLLLGEKGVDPALMEERVWERREDFLRLNPAGEVPVFVEEDGLAVSGFWPLVEYLEETRPDPAFLPPDPRERAEVRRIADWFARKFAAEVSEPLIYEKVTKRFLSVSAGGGGPEMAIVRTALHNIRYHLDFVCFLMESRTWLAGDRISLADIVAAAHFSCLDYVGDVPWNQYDGAKEWYVRLKSRPAFRTLLADHVPGMPPPRAYADLDF